MPSQTFDQKLRWGGLLENPWISKVQRLCLDGGRLAALRKILQPYSFRNFLDLGCGLGEYSTVHKARCVGIDNSLKRVAYAKARYKKSSFCVGDVRTLPFSSKTFDCVLFVDTSHHLSNEEFSSALKEIKRVSRKYIIVTDPVKTENQSRLSTFFYELDRGGAFRYSKDMQEILLAQNDAKLIRTHFFKTTPGLYSRAVFVLEVL